MEMIIRCLLFLILGFITSIVLDRFGIDIVSLKGFLIVVIIATIVVLILNYFGI